MYSFDPCVISLQYIEIRKSIIQSQQPQMFPCSSISHRNIYQSPTSPQYCHSTRKSSQMDAEFATEIQLHIKKSFYAHIRQCSGCLDYTKIQKFFYNCLNNASNIKSKQLLKSMLIQFDTSSKMVITIPSLLSFVSAYFPYSTGLTIYAPDTSQFKPQSTLNYHECLCLISGWLFNPKISLQSLSSQFLSFSPNQMLLSKQQFVHRFFHNQLQALRIRPAVYMMDEVYDYLVLRQEKHDGHDESIGATEGSDLETSRTIHKGLTMLNYVHFLKDVHKCYQRDSKI